MNPSKPASPARLPASLFALASAAALAACANPGHGGGPEDAGNLDASGSGSSSSSSSSGGSSSSSSGSGGGTSSSSSGGSGSSSSSSGSTTHDSGSGGSGSSSGATNSDAGIGGANAAIHDDFSSGSLSAWQLTDMNGTPNTQYTPVTTVTVESTMVHSPPNAVHVASGGGFFGMTPPAASYYGRAWVYFGADPGTNHWAFVEGVGPTPDGGGGQATQIRIGGRVGTSEVNYSVNDDEVLAAAADGGVEPPPIGKWICVEFYYGKDSLSFWIDSVPILTVTPTTVWEHGATTPPWSPQYVAARLGYASFGSNAIDVYYDDVAFDANRIGCN